MPETSSSQYRFSEAADKALDQYYARYGSNQNTEQKINVLQKALGESQFYAVGGDVPTEAKLACLEYEWLALHQLIDLELA